MGVSTDAIVFYGYCWDDQSCGYDEEDDRGQVITGGVEWGHHCSDASPMRYLAIEDSKVTAWRGYPKPLQGTSIPLRWEDWLEAELERTGVEPPEGENQPGWWIVSWYG
jgi:hypothetical protein